MSKGIGGAVGTKGSSGLPQGTVLGNKPSMGVGCGEGLCLMEVSCGQVG